MWTSTEPPETPSFDRALDSWVLSRYGDVAAALRDPGLVPASPLSTSAVALGEVVHAQFRAEALKILAPAQVRQWEQEFSLRADRRVRALPAGRAVDWMGEFARPWSLEVAGLAAGVAENRLERMGTLARSVFEAAAEPYNTALGADSRRATGELARCFTAAPQLYVQMFVALAHTLPAFLGNAWLALVEHPDIWSRLAREPALVPKAIDELLRFAGPAKAQFRRAVAPVTLGRAIQPGERLILRLDRANRDPERFENPDELRIDRSAADHLAFGAGVHACIGGMLIRSAAGAATRALLGSFGPPEGHTAETANRLAMRYVESLEVLAAK
jgi:cytochrome P450